MGNQEVLLSDVLKVAAYGLCEADFQKMVEQANTQVLAAHSRLLEATGQTVGIASYDGILDKLEDALVAPEEPSTGDSDEISSYLEETDLREALGD